MADSGTQAVVCERCSRLISAADMTCPFCGAIRIGGRTSAHLRDWVRVRRIPDVLFAATVAVYVISLAMSGPEIFKIPGGGIGGILGALGPTSDVLGFLGAVNRDAVVHGGEPWRLLTYAFLHAGLLHIGFNMVWLRQVGPFLEDEFGPFRFATIYLGSAILGGAAVVLAGSAAVGASGAIFGLTGAGFAYGKRRGGTWGAQLRGTFGQWALYGIVFTLVVPGISIAGHLGGLIGGFALGWLLAPRIRRSSSSFVEPPLLTILGATLLTLVPVSFAASFAKGLLMPGPESIDEALRIRGPNLVAQALLRTQPLDVIGIPEWSIDVPRGWRSHVRELPNASILYLASGAGFGFTIQLGPPSVAPRAMAVEVASAMNDGVAPDDGAIESTDDAATAALSTDARAFRVHVRRIDGERNLIVTSSLSGPVDRDAWRELFGRVVASIRSTR